MVEKAAEAAGDLCYVFTRTRRWLLLHTSMDAALGGSSRTDSPRPGKSGEAPGFDTVHVPVVVDVDTLTAGRCVRVFRRRES
jgi:hypothetical protein